MKFISIPQKCFGIITPNTDPEIGGVYTDGLSECSGVVVCVQSDDWFILCHADPQTDLRQGIRNWVSLIPKTCGNIMITYDIPPGRSPDALCYTSQIETAIGVLHASGESRNITYEVADSRGKGGVIVYRNAASDQHVQYRRDAEFDLIDEKHEVERGDMQAYVAPIIESLGEKCYQPICVFDGRDILTIENIRAQHPALEGAFVTAERSFTV